jgi:hypothetical protein
VQESKAWQLVSFSCSVQCIRRMKQTALIPWGNISESCCVSTKSNGFRATDHDSRPRLEPTALPVCSESVLLTHSAAHIPQRFCICEDCEKGSLKQRGCVANSCVISSSFSDFCKRERCQAEHGIINACAKIANQSTDSLNRAMLPVVVDLSSFVRDLCVDAH